MFFLITMVEEKEEFSRKKSVSREMPKRYLEKIPQ